MARIGPPHELTRRAVLRGTALAGAGVALSGLPLLPARAASSEGWPNIAAMAHDYVSTHKVANMIAYLGHGDAEPELVGEGRDTMGGDRKSDADSLYRIYSMTKPITGMAAMILIAEGRLGLDQPLAEIIPAFEHMMVQKEYDGSVGAENLEPAERPILIRHLLTHTGGIGYSIVQQGPIAEMMRDLGVVTGQVSRVPIPEIDRGAAVPSLAEFAERLAIVPLVYQPGTRWSYSCGLDLMGRVIEIVSGQSFDAFLKERIFDPCGMDSTFFRVPESELYRLTTNYVKLGELLLPADPATASVFALDPPYPMGGSGLVCSPRDYDRFLKMIAGYGTIEGRQALPEAAVRLGTSDLLPDPSTVAGTQLEGMGFGAGGRTAWSAGSHAFGWGGAAYTAGFVDLDRGLRAGLFTQIMPSGVYPIYDDFEAAALADIILREKNA